MIHILAYSDKVFKRNSVDAVSTVRLKIVQNSVDKFHEKRRIIIELSEN